MKLNMRTTLIAACLIGCMTLGSLSCGKVAAQKGVPEQVVLHADGAPVKIACVGDSITAGVGASTPAKDYPCNLAKLLGSRFEVRNFGESGATLLKNGDSPYWKRLSFKPSGDFLPDAVVVMLGANDSKPWNWDAHKAEFKGDYEALLDYYAQLPSHPQLYVCLPTCILSNHYQIRESAEEEEISVIKEVSVEKSAKVIDVHDEVGSDSANFVDGVHPNDAGYVQLARSVCHGLTNGPVILAALNPPFYKSTTIAIDGFGDEVRYTLNGKTPNAKSELFKAPFVITKAVVVKAQIFKNKHPYGIDAEIQVAPVNAP